MTITLNNRKEEIPGTSQLNVTDLLKHKNFTFKFLAVRVNGTPVKSLEYPDTIIEDGDQVTVHHLISGG
ncbi:MAG: sulfur carrier protein ThiS [Bacteroidales bacterium]